MSRGVATSRNDCPFCPIRKARPPHELMSLDALRGFDMFWIIGGEDAAGAGRT